MLKVGDTVKVISDTVSHWDPEERTEYIPIGTICVVRNINYNQDGTAFYEIEPIGRDYTFFYFEKELEKGHMEWISEHKKQMWIKRYAFFYKRYLQYIVDDMPLQLTNKFEVQLQEIQIVLREIFHIQNEEIEKINHELEERIL